MKKIIKSKDNKCGKCFYCGTETQLIKKMVCVSTGYYCSLAHALLSLIEHKEGIQKEIECLLKKVN